MRCFSCGINLTDKEANRKYELVEQPKNPEDAYINLCTKCLKESEISHYLEDWRQSDELQEDNNHLEVNWNEGDCI